ncbi:MAG: hypothetical protein ACYC4R_12955 [Anaerolineae bacterium]
MNALPGWLVGVGGAVGVKVAGTTVGVRVAVAVRVGDGVLVGRSVAVAVGEGGAVGEAGAKVVAVALPAKTVGFSRAAGPPVVRDGKAAPAAPPANDSEPVQPVSAKATHTASVGKVRRLPKSDTILIRVIVLGCPAGS